MDDKNHDFQTPFEENQNNSQSVDVLPAPQQEQLPIDNPVSHLSEISGDGLEKVVYQQDYSQTPQVKAAKNYINYLLLSAIIFASEAWIIGLVFRTIYSSKIVDFSYICFFLSITSLIKVTVLYYFASLDHENSVYYFRSIFDSINNALICQAFYFYFIGIYSPSLVLAYVIGSFILHTLKIVIFYKKGLNFLFESISIFQEVMLLLFTLRLLNPEENSIWTLFLVLSTSIFYSFVYTASALTFFVFVLTIMVVFRFFMSQEVDYIGIVYFYTVWVLTILISTSVCFGMFGLKDIFEGLLFIPFTAISVPIPTHLNISGVLWESLAVFLLLVTAIVHFKLKNPLLRKISNSSAKKILLKTYFVEFSLNLVNISGIFFRSIKNSNEEKNIKNSTKDFEECVVCQVNMSSYLFSPCNHCVLCESCVGNFLESQDRCPICKSEIKRCLHLSFDQIKGKYMTNKAFKIMIE